MLNAINNEIGIRNNFFESKSAIQTIYFGGGTPSVLSQKELEQILLTVRNNFEVSKDAEITFECNPDDLNRDYLQALHDAGINRLSIGIQSFDDDILSWMNRSHSNSQSLQCIEDAGKMGFDNLTIDLIYGIPQLTMEEWSKTVDFALDLPINHISAYSLTLENNTPYKRLVDQKKYKKPNDDLASKQFEMLIDKIDLKGWEHYEVSNFCKPGQYSKHNTAYWQGKKYLGIGPSAHSFNGNQRFWNVSDNTKYVASLQQGKAMIDGEDLSLMDKYNEHILTGLRTKWGVNLDEIEQKYQVNVLVKDHIKLEEWTKRTWIEVDNNCLRLTKKGFLFADFISSELFLDQDYSSQTLS